MKTLFTLALTFFILNAAFSQVTVSRVTVQSPNFDLSYNRSYGNGYNNGYYNNGGYNNGAYNNNNYYDNADRRTRIEHVNDIYDQKIEQVRCMDIPGYQRREMIRQLRWERADKIRHIYVTSYDDGYNNNGGYNNDGCNR